MGSVKKLIKEPVVPIISFWYSLDWMVRFYFLGALLVHCKCCMAFSSAKDGSILSASKSREINYCFRRREYISLSLISMVFEVASIYKTFQFWVVLPCDLREGRRLADVIINSCLFLFCIVMRLYSNWS